MKKILILFNILIFSSNVVFGSIKTENVYTSDTGIISNISNVANTKYKFLIYNLSGTQTLDQYNAVYNASNSSSNPYQSITCAKSGKLSSITLRNGSGVTATNCTVTFYEGVGRGGTLLATESNLTFPHAAVINVQMTDYPWLVSGNTYSIGISGTNWGTSINTSDVYPGGNFNGIGSYDAFFYVYVDEGKTFAIRNDSNKFSINNLEPNYDFELVGTSNLSGDCIITGERYESQLAYGGMGASYNTTATNIDASGVYYDVTQNILPYLPSKNISVADSILTIQKAGIYRVQLSASISGSNSKQFHGGISKNNALPLGCLEFNHTFGANSTDATVGAGGHLSLDINDTLRIKIENMTDNSDIIFRNWYLYIDKVAPK